MKKYKVNLEKMYFVPFVCYLYAENKDDAFAMYQKELKEHNLMHYGIRKKDIELVSKKAKKENTVKFVHL